MAKPPRPVYRDQGFFVLRSPSLPFEALLDWSEGLTAAGTPEDPDVWRRDVEILRARLREKVEDPLIREALFVASPSLVESIDSWRKRPDDKRGQRIERSLVSYFTRMATRPTPFGLFAGCSLGKIRSSEKATRLELEPGDAYRRVCRLDNDYLFLLTDAIGRSSEVRSEQTFRPSSTLYKLGGRWRYVESHVRGRHRSHHLVGAEADDYLDATLERAREGESLEELAAALVEQDEEISIEEAREYVLSLVDSQLLISELSPIVTGPDPIDDLVGQLESLEATVDVAATLRGVRDDIRTLEHQRLGTEDSRYLRIAERLEQLPAQVELSRLFQIDLFKSSRRAVLGQGPMQELLRAVEVLHRLTRGGEIEVLRQFRQDFLTRYDQQEIPLVEALDEELGIGFDRSHAPSAEAGPLIDGLGLGRGERRSYTSSWDPLDHLLFPKVLACTEEGAKELRLTSEDLKELPDLEPDPLPDAFSIMAVLEAESVEALDRGDFRIWVKGTSGPSGATLLGRFCHGDPDLHTKVLEHLRAEETHRPGAVFAEITHLPEGRIGNVICRPVLRDYEIPFLGRSGAPPERRIPLSDILVSVRGERIVLFSRSLGRELIPRLTNAHNFTARTIGVYKFLCLLQSQGLSAPGFRWRPAFESAPFLPRLVVGRTVLHRARWRMNGREIEELAAANGHELFRTAQTWRQRRGFPRWISLIDGDNQLVTDWDNPLSVQNLIRTVKGRPAAILSEVFPAPDRLCASSSEGRFTHEIVVPVVKVREEKRPSDERHAGHRTTAGRPSAGRPSAVRNFLPGSEWLYVKFFTGTTAADEILRESVAPLVRELVGEGVVRRWFFLRYGDPRWHLRLRFAGEPKRLVERVLPRLAAAAESQLRCGRLLDFEVGMYEREVERYGGDRGVELSEEIFFHDSWAVMRIVEEIEGEEGEEARWRLALMGLDALLGDVLADDEARHRVARRMKESWAEEFRVGKPTRRQLGDRFRTHRRELDSLLDPSSSTPEDFAPAVEIFAERSRALAEPVEQLRRALGNREISTSIEDLAASYCHMHVNRLLRSAQRAHEVVLYDFLFRIYDGRIGRQRKMAHQNRRGKKGS